MISATAEPLCVRLLVRCQAPEATPGEAKWRAMHNSAARTAAAGFMDMPNSSTDAYVVAVDRRRIGVAVAAGGRLHFIAADPDFRPLDGSSFLHVAQLEQAAERLARTVRGPRVLPGGYAACAYRWQTEAEELGDGTSRPVRQHVPTRL